MFTVCPPCYVYRLTPVLRAVQDCEDFLSKELLQPGGRLGSDWEDRLLRQIHTLGDLAQLVPHRVNKRCFLMLQNIIYVEKSQYHSRQMVSKSAQNR